MKHIYSVIFVLALSLTNLYAGNNRLAYLDSIKINNSNLIKNGRTVSFSMDVDFSKAKIKTQHTVALTPVLVSADGQKELAFPPVIIDGKTRYNVYLRAQSLKSVERPPFHNEDSVQVIINRKNGKEQHYAYSASTPYERWMLDGKVEIREEVHGCVNCGMGKSEKPLLTEVLPTFVPEWMLDTIEPEPEPLKVRAEERTARLQFHWDSDIIVPGLKNNRVELDTILNSILLAKNNKDLDITGLSITGYASPEGTVKHNIDLSMRRAKSLAAYVSKQVDIPSNMLAVDWKGEDWKGFLDLFKEHKEIPDWDKVNEIIQRYSDDQDLCEHLIRKTVPEAYRYMDEHLFPILRCNKYRIEYNVHNFDVEKARKIIRERPDLLSLKEMNQVAGSYGYGTAEYDEVMDIALEYFPNSPAALNERAERAMDQKDYLKAIDILERPSVTRNNPALLNTLGVAYVFAGEYHKAEAAFRQAAQDGSAAAEHNLSDVQKVIDQL